MSEGAPYPGKFAYRGEIAANYERDRINEPVWQEEQSWMSTWSRSVPRGAHLLDLPAGTGRFLPLWLERGARITAADISEDMLAQIRQRWKPDGSRLTVERADAEQLPYADNSFDFVVCWRLLHLLPPPTAERVFREFARVCAGEIVVEVFNVSEISRLRLALRRLKAALSGHQRVSESANTPWSHIESFPHAEHDLRARFAAAGLQVTRAETLGDYRGTKTRVYLLRRAGG